MEQPVTGLQTRHHLLYALREYMQHVRRARSGACFGQIREARAGMAECADRVRSSSRDLTGRTDVGEEVAVALEALREGAPVREVADGLLDRLRRE